MNRALCVWAEIDLGCITRNVARMKARLAPGAAFLAVVKANAYGHGEVEAATAALQGGADWLGVARVEEGAALRAAGIGAPILLLSQPPMKNLPAAVEYDLTPSVYSADAVRELSEIGRSAGKSVSVHLKVDTGMHRYGVGCDQAESFVDFISGLSRVDLTGIWSHLAVAEELDNSFTSQQLKLFLEMIDSLGSRADGLVRHISNSAGTIALPEAHLDLVRAGIAIYGIAPSDAVGRMVELEPAMSFRSRIGMSKRVSEGEAMSYGLKYTMERDGYVSTVPCGYADGLRRNLSNVGEVLVKGRRWPISGTITMDHFLIDSGDEPLEEGEEVVIVGAQGDEEITAQEMADHLGTIPWEIVCGVSARVRRIYKR
ncbi:MAG: alanine racemase [Actinomycetota bacterium]